MLTQACDLILLHLKCLRDPVDRRLSYVVAVVILIAWRPETARQAAHTACTICATTSVISGVGLIPIYGNALQGFQ